jgi:hypothetical protein
MRRKGQVGSLKMVEVVVSGRREVSGGGGGGGRVRIVVVG